MKILIVEDNKLLGDSMKKGLSEAGWTVDIAYDGEEGFLKASHSFYDLFLFDRGLPKLSGTALMKSCEAKEFKHPL